MVDFEELQDRVNRAQPDGAERNDDWHDWFHPNHPNRPERVRPDGTIELYGELRDRLFVDWYFGCHQVPWVSNRTEHVGEGALPDWDLQLFTGRYQCPSCADQDQLDYKRTRTVELEGRSQVLPYQLIQDFVDTLQRTVCFALVSNITILTGSSVVGCREYKFSLFLAPKYFEDDQRNLNELYWDILKERLGFLMTEMVVQREACEFCKLD